jgi:hypothetical protein
VKELRERTTASDHIRAIDALAMTLNGSESPIAAAAIITKSYCGYVEQSLKNIENNRVYPFWVTLCDAARAFGSAQSRHRLIDLLHGMSTQPDTRDTSGSLSTEPNGSVYWRDLPGLPFALCDELLCSLSLLWSIAHLHLLMTMFLGYFHPYDHSPDELNEYLEQTPYLLNRAMFAATLFEQGFRVRGLNLSVQADRFLADGIESSYNDEHFVKSQEWKGFVPASTAWIMIAGETIYKLCLEGHEPSRHLNLRSKRVWNKPRWELWKGQLRGFKRRHDLDEECRGCATRALAKMVEVEKVVRV